MANTYVKIASVTVGSGGAANMDFTSIPGTYDDLALLITTRSTGSGVDNLAVKFNTSSANFTGRYLVGNGATASSASVDVGGQVGLIPGTSTTASTFGSTTVYVPNYAGSTNKSYSSDNVTENNATTAYAMFIAGLWSQTAAITGITVYGQTANLAQYSTAVLYGIKKS